MKLDRRTFLRASGISLALPWLEAMGAPVTAARAPKRFCTVYFPYGVAMPKDDNPDKAWGWFPEGEGGRDYVLSKAIEPLAPHRDNMTILGGLSHPRMWGGGGHDSGDTFLTGAELRRGGSDGDLKNSISLDQVIADHLGRDTRFRSVVLSNDGGVGIPTRANTLSFNREGQPIPSLNRPALVFERLFGLNDDSIEAQRRGLTRTGSHLDLLLDEARGLNRKLGKRDQEKMDEYLTSVRQVVQQVERSAAWLDVPKPKVNATGLTLDADDTTPGELIQTMLDLMVLAFQTDSTRVATYQLASMHGAISVATTFPQLLGYANNMHSLAHGANKPGGAKKNGEWQAFLAKRMSDFLSKLDSIEEGEGTLLDNTLVYYGSSNSNTHNNRNYPLVLAGARNMGFTHGHYLRYGEDTPLANLYATMLERLGTSEGSFADSSGKLREVVV
ncbi:MAG: DUF1552 domain-containing protein [Verrucomicrobiota bacterium]